jgi:hypothetical protein
MKSIKTASLALTGIILIIILFSFKNSEPTKEYLTVYTGAFKTEIYFPDGSNKEIEYKNAECKTQVNKIINDLAKEGWIVIQVNNTANIYTNYFYLERVK